jgi:hypothetical protein
VQSNEGQTRFWGNIATIFRVKGQTRQETNMKCAASRAVACLLYAGFLFGLLFDSEDGGDMFLRNVS